MARNWKGYRPLVVADRRFRWKCDFNHPFEVFSAGYAEDGHAWSSDKLLVRPEDLPHCLLTVSWSACRGPVVTPGFVRVCVNEAVRRGWPDAEPMMELAGAEVPTSAEEGGN